MNQDEMPPNEPAIAPPPISISSPPPPPKRGFGEWLKKTLGPVGVAIVAILVKFKFALLAMVKYGPVMLKSGGTMIFSMFVYGWMFGWKFGVGFVLLLFVHECGHLLAAKKYGMNVSAPMFIPFFGAVILLRESPQSAWVEAVIGIAGPILGSIGALASEGIYEITGNPLFRALAYVGFMLNLFNLMPVGFLDGGRVTAAISPWLWLVGFVILVFLICTSFNPILLFVLVAAVPRLFSLFRPKTAEQQRYYEVTAEQRITMSVIYFGLAGALYFAMKLTFMPRGSH